MASDTQYTGLFRETGPKAWELRDNMIAGIAGPQQLQLSFLAQASRRV